MKNKIKQFAKGEFQTERPDVIFSKTHLLISVGEGEIYQGSFCIGNRKDGVIRGLVYPSSFRVRLQTSGFEGNPVKVGFSFDSTGLVPGHIEQGKFTVVSSGGEYELTYTVIVEKPFIMTEHGKIQTTADFRKLAMLDFSEAKRLFRSRQFYDVLKYEDVRVRNLYDNMRRWSLDEQALEEFLVGIKQKEKIFLTLPKAGLECRNVMEDQEETFEIVKNTWGYLPARLYAQGDFLSLRREEITTEDFVGDHFRVEYIIRKDALHAGHNFGRIVVETPYETLCFSVDVHQRGTVSELRREKGLLAEKGIKAYLQMLFGKISLDDWAQETVGYARQICELDPKDEYYQLLQAHVYLRAKREEEARWILENGSFQKFSPGRKVEVSAYYQFLTALLKKDAADTARALDEISRLYIRHPYSWPLLCMLIDLDPKYRDYNDRLRVLERQFFNGSNQILLYAEAYVCFRENVLLLRKLESFEVQVLNFAAKYRILTKELALYAAERISQQKKYNKKLARILMRAYEMYEEDGILHALCMQLIKGNRIGEEYAAWYEKAVQKELKIAQLYEFYMMSMDPQRVKGAFPRIVYLYFRHGISLDYRRTALLYANILTYEEEGSEIWQFYQEQMIGFTKEQLVKRRVDDSLRVLYNRFINEQTMTPDEMEALYDICHKYHVTTSQKGMKYVLVIEKDGSIRQRAAYTEHGANVYLYDKESRIVWEGADGRHYTDSIPYDIVRLYYEMRFMELSRRRMSAVRAEEKRGEKAELSFENLRHYGMDAFAAEEVFLLCAKHIRGQEKEEEDEFLLYLCFELLKSGLYDKATLHYLSHFYCGATRDMKFVWQKAREHGVSSRGLAERIVTQMLFTETMFAEAEIFEDYYMKKPYFRLKQAYLAYASYQYVVKGRMAWQNLFAIIMKEYREKEDLADICKAAILKYFSDKETDGMTEQILRGYLRELCAKRMVFAFYQDYPKEWLADTLLYDKYIAEYHGEDGAKVWIVYRIGDGETQTEQLFPVYETICIREFTLYEQEQLEYYFQEEKDGKRTVSDAIRYTREDFGSCGGKYGRLNELAGMPPERLPEAMAAYAREDELARTFFGTF